MLLHCAQVDEPAVWSELGHAYLDASQVPDAIAAYLRSSDSSRYVQVIGECRVHPPCGFHASLCALFCLLLG